MNNIPEFGQPNENPIQGDIIWEHPRVVAVCHELEDAAIAFTKEKERWLKETSFVEWCKRAYRLENAAIAYTDTIREYTIKDE